MSFSEPGKSHVCCNWEHTPDWMGCRDDRSREAGITESGQSEERCCGTAGLGRNGCQVKGRESIWSRHHLTVPTIAWQEWSGGKERSVLQRLSWEWSPLRRIQTQEQGQELIWRRSGDTSIRYGRQRGTVGQSWQGVGFYDQENELFPIPSLFYEVNKTLWLTQTERVADSKNSKRKENTRQLSVW